ncbi:hypothetical protein [Streptomyces spectabilis]|uniref:Uncharacterized protein n=1 Tax=Streptomyces spectabilis TaxID=68270 RepID=A0A7W8B4S3_STRST|nr:hypothetical protein [Streptomyces spectabilis]MBB5109205.1 hypothetical protein [Streptomyces spectabilis]MCI3907760.1 hypothetical protein [Streptomyces spectabilis]
MKTFYERTWDRDQCAECRRASVGSDALRAVLASLPPKLVRACGGGVSHEVISCIRDQLSYVPVAVLQARIDRRWWGRWATSPLQREAEGNREAYRPDDVALWLVEPTSCANRCEDGWLMASAQEPGADDRPCPVCAEVRAAVLAESAREDDFDDVDSSGGAKSDRTVAEAVAHRSFAECSGSGGSCGAPVRAPHTQCPACLDWPWCGCGRRRFDPAVSEVCVACADRAAAASR